MQSTFQTLSLNSTVYTCVHAWFAYPNQKKFLNICTSQQSATSQCIDIAGFLTLLRLPLLPNMILFQWDACNSNICLSMMLIIRTYFSLFWGRVMQAISADTLLPFGSYFLLYWGRVMQAINADASLPLALLDIFVNAQITPVHYSCLRMA